MSVICLSVFYYLSKMKITLLFLSVFLSANLFGQVKINSNKSEIKGTHSFESFDEFKYKNSINLELFGHGISHSIYYERLLLNRRFKTSAHIGFSIPNLYSYADLNFPLRINGLYELSNNHHLEFGLGVAFIRTEFTNNPFDSFYEPKHYFHGLFNLGWRYQKFNGRYVFKVLISPWINKWRTTLYSVGHINLWAAASVGYNFGGEPLIKKATLSSDSKY